MHFIKIKSRITNGDIFTRIFKRIGILYTSVFLDLNGFSFFLNHNLVFDNKLLFPGNYIGIFIKFRCLKRFTPMRWRDHVRNRNIRIVGRCQTVVLFDEFAIVGGNDKGRFLKDIFFMILEKRVIEIRASIFYNFTFRFLNINDCGYKCGFFDITLFCFKSER